MRVADYIAGKLVEHGVRATFLVSGGGMMHLLDAVSRKPTVRIVPNHHEQASAMAAEGYARQTEGLGACYATSGPGATNTLTGVVGAWQDSSPVLVITGQSKVSQTIAASGLVGLRQFGVFEVDIVEMARPVTKYAAVLDDPGRVRYHVEKAIALALHGRPGPVLLDVPLDVQGAPMDPDAQDGFDPAGLGAPEGPAPAVLQDVTARLRHASRPVLLAGHGVRASGATDAFRDLVETLGVPVVTTQLAHDLLPYEHPQFVGHPGPKGDRAGNFALQRADLILALGSSLHISTTGFELDRFAPEAFKIIVDPDPLVLVRPGVDVDVRVEADVAATVAALRSATGAPVGTNGSSDWIRRCSDWKTRFAVRSERHRRGSGTINLYHLVDALGDAMRGGQTLVTDAGSCYYAVGQAFRVKDDQRVIVSGALGAMGYALPASIGASAADPARTVVCLTGDGSLQTNVHELGVLALHQMDVKLVIVNNDGYASIRTTQDTFFAGNRSGTDRASGTALPDLERLAAAYDLPYRRCDQDEELPSVLADVLSTAGPVLLEVVTHRDQEVIPTVKSKRLESGGMQSMAIDEMFPFDPPGGDPDAFGGGEIVVR